MHLISSAACNIFLSKKMPVKYDDGTSQHAKFFNDKTGLCQSPLSIRDCLREIW